MIDSYYFYVPAAHHCWLIKPFLISVSLHMRFWLIVLIFAVALTSIPLITDTGSTRIYMRSALSLAQRVITRQAFSTNNSLAVPSLQRLQHSTTASTTAIDHSALTSMPDTLPPPAQNPMPVLEKAGPADPKKAEELPKLSTDEFRVYNKLAVMMDAYVSPPMIPLSHPRRC